MNHYQISVGINNLPISLILVSSGHVALVKNSRHPTIYCDYLVEGKIPVIMSEQDISVDGVVYQYNTGYLLSEHEQLKKWLIQEQLEEPSGFIFN